VTPSQSPLTPNSEFAAIAPVSRIERTVAALIANGFEAAVAATGAEARQRVLELLPEGAEVFNATSQTLQAIGLVDDIERSGRYQPVRARMYTMDRDFYGREIRKLAAAPDYYVGSVHAVTEQGMLMVASFTGSQLGPLASGAGKVILVVGAQKVVVDREAGFRRIYEYAYPLEDERLRRTSGIGSGVSNILVINKVVAAERVSVILVQEKLGF
jgi:LUD domain